MKTLIVLIGCFLSIFCFAQHSADLDWNSFNNMVVCTRSESGVMTALIKENKIKKIIMKKEVGFDVGRVAEFQINGNNVQVGKCVALPISQVSMGTTARCIANDKNQRYYIYIQRYVNAVSGQQQQTVSVMTDNNGLNFLTTPGSCP